LARYPVTNPSTMSINGIFTGNSPMEDFFIEDPIGTIFGRPSFLGGPRVPRRPGGATTGLAPGDPRIQGLAMGCGSTRVAL
jgi:hypothetical protein